MHLISHYKSTKAVCLATLKCQKRVYNGMIIKRQILPQKLLDLDNKHNLARLLTISFSCSDFLKLVKFRLSCLNVFSAAMGYSLCAKSISVLPLSGLIFGTLFSAFSASILNQIIEAKFDKKMRRTKKRPLPLNRISVSSAFLFSIVFGLSGNGILYSTFGPLPAIISLATVVFYNLIYTPLKRVTPYNTEVGALIGALPPIIGCAAVPEKLFGVEAFLMFSLLFCWQMPHFMVIAWKYRDDYASAGHKMISVNDLTHKTLNKGLFYCGVMFLLPLFTVLSGITPKEFLFAGSAANLILLLPYLRHYWSPSVPNANRSMMFGFLHLTVFCLLVVLFSVQGCEDGEKVKASSVDMNLLN